MNKRERFLYFPAVVMTLLFLHPITTPLFAQINCGNVTVNAGADELVCEPGNTVQLNGSVAGDLIGFQWSPGNLVGDSTSLITTATVNETTDFVLNAFSISDVDLIQNGDFSQGNVGFTTDYLDRTGGGVGAVNDEGTYAIDDSPRDVHRRFSRCDDHTTGNGNMMIVNGSGTANNVWCQNITIKTGTDYVFRAWATSVNSENPARLQFSINGQLLGNVFQANGNTCEWQPFFANWQSSTETAAEICIANVNLNPAGNDFAIDDIEFREVCRFTDTIRVELANLNPQWDAPSGFCANNPALDLNTLLADSATLGGTWLVDGSLSPVLNPSAIAVGPHRIEYQVTQGVCMETLGADVAIISPPNAGMPGPQQLFCAGETGTVLLENLIEGEDTGGSWTVNQAPGNVNFDLSGAAVSLGDLPAGEFIFNYTVMGEAPCTDAVALATLMIRPSPVADAGEDTALDCLENLASIGGAGTSSGSDFRYEWTSVGGNDVLDPDLPMTEVEVADTYRLIVTDNATDCSASDEVTVTSVVDDVAAVATGLPPSCEAPENGGSILISEITGGMGPYVFALDGGAFGSSEVFSGLQPGTYDITVRDANNCQTIVQANIEATSILNTELEVKAPGDPPAIALGDSVRLELLVNIPVANVDSIVWEPALPNCPDCLNPVVGPTKSTTYRARVTDISGCTSTSEALIIVQRENLLFAPNAFSPNNDGINDLFMLNPGKGVETINSLQILDRWGNLVFERQNLIADDPRNGWDGTLNQQRLSPGVYVYFAEITLVSGETLVTQGDVTLVN